MIKIIVKPDDDYDYHYYVDYCPTTMNMRDMNGYRPQEDKRGRNKKKGLKFPLLMTLMKM